MVVVDFTLHMEPQAAQAHYLWVRAKEVIWSEYTRIIGQYKTRTADCGLRTADYGLRTGFKIRTRYKTRTGKYGLGIKHGLGIKRGLQTADWV